MNLKETREAIAIVRTRIESLTGQDPIAYISHPGDRYGVRYVWHNSYNGREVTLGAPNTLRQLWNMERDVLTAVTHSICAEDHR